MWGNYVRVSTDLQAESGTSLDTQLEANRKKALELGYDLTREIIYRDEGESGADIDRPALNSLRVDIEEKIITEAIFCYDPDRLSRKLHYQLILEEEFTSSGIKLIFVNSDNRRETPEGMLLFQMQGAIAEFERAKIKERTIRGKLAKAKQGKVMPMRYNPYGYIWKDGKLEINEYEVEAVKLIYDMYIHGYNTKKIGEKLISMGYNARFTQWNANTIIGMIKNEIYIGKFWYNTVKHERTGLKTKSGKHALKTKIRPESDRILINIPAIIEESVWNKAQAQIIKNTQYSARNTKLNYLVRGGYLRCADCGKVLSNSSYGYNTKNGKVRVGMYRCKNSYPSNYGKEKCPCTTITAKILDDLIWNDLLEIIFNPENIQHYDEKKNTKKIERDIKNLETQVVKIKKEKEKIITLYKKDVLSFEEIEQELGKIKKQEQLLEGELNNLKNQNYIQDEMTSKEKEKLLEIIKTELQNGMELSFEEKKIIFERLVKDIVIHLRSGEATLAYSGFYNFEKKHTF